MVFGPSCLRLISAGPGTPGALFVNTGLIALHTDPSGIQTVSEQIGTQEDLCAVLQ